MNDVLTIGNNSYLTIGAGEFLTLGKQEKPRNAISFSLNLVLEWTKEFVQLSVKFPLK